MLIWLIQVTIISIIFIFVVHNLLVFFKDTLTVPKVKDLVNSPSQKYQNMFNTISGSNSYTSIDNLPTDNTGSTMKNELKSFLKKQLNNDIVGSNDQSSYYSNF